MKRQFIYLLATALLGSVACSTDEVVLPGDSGKITLGCSTDPSIDITRAATTAVPAVSDFKITIAGGEVNSTWNNLAAYQTEDPLFPAGDYTTSIAYGDPDTEGVDCPYYYASTQVTVVARKTVTATLTAKVAKAQVQVYATAQFQKYFHDAAFKLTTGSANTFDFTPGETDDTVIWVKAATSISITGSAKRQSQTGIGDGDTITFATQSLAATTAATCHIFKFDAADAGSATLTITLSDGASEVIPIELNDNAIK